MNIRFIHFLSFLLITSCGQRVSKYLGSTAHNQVINMEADEDGDGINNATELKRGLDRLEFDRPLLSLIGPKLTAKSDWQTFLFQTQDIKHNNLSILPDSESHQQFLVLPQLNIEQRWLIEEQAKKDEVLQVELDGVLDWNLNDLFHFQSLNLELGVYHWPSSRVFPLNSQITLNQVSRGNFKWIFTLSESDKEIIVKQKIKWDFVVMMKDSQWRSPISTIRWEDVKNNYVHFLANQQMNRKLFVNKIDPIYFISKDPDFKLFENDDAVIGLPILENGRIYHQQRKGFNYEEVRNKAQSFSKYQNSVEHSPLKNALSTHQWERINWRLFSPELSTRLIERSVSATWIGQKPCEIRGGRFQKMLCEGQILTKQCMASYEEIVHSEIKKIIPAEEVTVHLKEKDMTLKEWIDASGAVLLEFGTLLRWEGSFVDNPMLRPLGFAWSKENKKVEFGYTGIRCPRVEGPSSQAFTHDQSRHFQEEHWIFKLEHHEY